MPPVLPRLLLMSIFAQALLPLVRFDLLAFAFLARRHSFSFEDP